MKIFKILLLTFSICFLEAREDINKDYNLAVTIHAFDKVHQNKIKSSVVKIEDEFKKLFIDEDMDINITFFDSEDNMLDEFKKFEKFNTAVFYSSYYLQHNEEIKKYAKEYFAFSNMDKFHSYIIVANKDSNINSLADLKGKSFANYTGNQNYSVWLDYVALKQLGVSYKNLISEEIDISKSSRLLLNLYFGKCDFTVVKKSVYEDMILLNPAIKKKLKVIKESKKMFIYGVGFFHKNTSNDIIEKFYKYTNDDSFVKNLNNAYKLLDQSSVQKISLEELRNLENFYNEYIKLKNRLR